MTLFLLKKKFLDGEIPEEKFNELKKDFTDVRDD